MRLIELNHSSSSSSTSTESVPSKIEGIHGAATNSSSSNSNPPSRNATAGKVANAVSASTLHDSKYRCREIMDEECRKAETREGDTRTQTEGRKYIQDDSQEVTMLHKPYSTNMSKTWTHEKRVLLMDIDFESK
jgi:hypothetical protein